MDKRNYIFLGLVLILSFFLFIGANVNTGNTGKYQIAGSGMNICILDTETGAVAQLLFKNSYTDDKRGYITAAEVQELLSK